MKRGSTTGSYAKPPGWRKALDRISEIGFVLGLALIAFVAGVLLSAAEIFPGPHIARAYLGGKAM